MSSGRFTRTFYESNAGVIYRARVQPETLTLSLGGVANSAPAGPTTGQGSANMSSSSRRLGINARSVSLAWTGTPPDGYDDRGVVRLPIMQPSVFNGIALGATGTYLGADVEVIGLNGEDIR